MRNGMLKKLRKLTKTGALVGVAVLITSCTPKPKEHVTITYNFPDDSTDRHALVREVIAAFEKQFDYIHVEPSFEKIDILKLGGKPGPDVFLADVDQLGNLAEKAAVDITLQITNDKKLMDAYYPEVASACKVDSRQYMMPVSYSTDILFFNVDLLQKAVAESRTYVNMQDLDFESIPKFAQAFVKKDGNQITRWALALPRPLLLIQSWGASPLAWNDVTINNELSRNALKFYASLLNEHHLVPPPEPQKDDGLDLFKQQKIVFFVGRTDDLAAVEKIKDFRWDIAPVPKGPKRMAPGMPQPGSMTPPPPTEIWPRHSRLSVNGNCIWVNSAHFAEAWEFTKFFSSAEALKILSRSRAGVPAAKVAAESLDFLHKPPDHINVLIEARTISRLDNMHNHSFWDEFSRSAFIDITGQLLEGKITVDDAIGFIEQIGKDLMERAKAEKKK
ncbi:MAG: extracellular solute-binding protein [Verrucomicrobiae bacterium]|nr:extracellular solute-binding protein [Verrucomicrobiae bacterium]